MDLNDFGKQAEKMLDYIIHYFENNIEKKIKPSVGTGYLRTLLPSTAPKRGVPFEKIMEDFNKCILPGLVRTDHPGFYAFYPSIPCYPSILNVLLKDFVGGIGLNWNTWHPLSDFETLVLDYYGKMIGLPDVFLSCSESNRGGGVIQTSHTDCFLLSMIRARQNMLTLITKRKPHTSKIVALTSFIVYLTRHCDIGVMKAVHLSLVNYRVLETDEDSRLRGSTLSRAVKEDKKIGLIPFFVSITLGTVAGVCDALDEIGPICKEHGLWLNVDASYAGNTFICPEMRHHLIGIEDASSFVVSPAKLLMVHRDCVALFTKDRFEIAYYLTSTRYVSHSEKKWSYRSNETYFAYKLWTVIRCYGNEGLQEHIRKHVRLAKLFEENVRKDHRFKVLACNFGIVCFRMNCSDELNRTLLDSINSTGKFLLNSFIFKGKFTIRFILCSGKSSVEDIMHVWSVICQFADEIFDKTMTIGGLYDFGAMWI